MRWRKRIIWVVVGLGVLAVLYVAGGGNTDEHIGYSCQVCRAFKSVNRFMGIPYWWRTGDTEFSRYYREQINSRHRHVWGACCGRVHSLYRGSCWDGSTAFMRLWPKTAMAIVKSLPDRQTKKAFCEQFLVPDHDREAYWERIRKACGALNVAYEENPNRRDWPEQLKKVGLYPKVEGKRR